MEARLRRQGDVTVIAISGSLGIEETQSFREVCVKRFSGQKVIFNLEKASFVGSTGLQAFLETLSTIEQTGQGFGVRLVGARSEFRRVISSLEGKRIEFFEEETSAAKDWLPLSVPDSNGGSTPG